jgi:trk system potassium uptake protein TrkH
MGLSERVLASFFQSITPRTAGFNTINQLELSEGGKLLTMLLMIIGGSPGSTAGGIKTVTFVVLIASSFSSAKQTPDINIFKRRLESDSIKKASAITVIYMLTALISTLILCSIEHFSLIDTMFEVFSALSTVGLSIGITINLSSTLSKLIFTLLMYGGKVGVLTLAASLAEKKEAVNLARPIEKIIIG